MLGQHEVRVFVRRGDIEENGERGSDSVYQKHGNLR